MLGLRFKSMPRASSEAGAEASKNDATSSVVWRGYAAYRSGSTLNSCRLIAV